MRVQITLTGDLAEQFVEEKKKSNQNSVMR